MNIATLPRSREIEEMSEHVRGGSDDSMEDMDHG